MKIVLTIILGFLFGNVLIASQAYSWFRIQEMFHFDSFHMYGLLFSAIGTAGLSLYFLKKLKVRSIYGNQLDVKPKPTQIAANVIGGLLFGLGWSISGACSAPLYILIGMHWQIGLILLVGALVGTFLYGAFKSKLPH
ncbi:MAG: hypothetical protein RIT43_1223 [Bacteroidota bacterium]|jgi:uncharacterized membrane protein YedE/YeeE